MAKLTFVWHLHQPQYRTADGLVHAPWVLLHAGGEYLTLVHALSATGLAGQVLNLTPVFLDQLAAYRDGTAHDPLLEALRTPARSLTSDGQRELLRWAFLLHPSQLRRWPRLSELAVRAGGAPGGDAKRRFTVQDLTDLQVLIVLAYAAPNLTWEPDLKELAERGAGFGEAARRQAAEWLAACPGRLLDGYRTLAGAKGVEISTSPFAHPIMPLLLDTGVVEESWAPHPAPAVPAFSAPEDAREHLRVGLEAMRGFGFAPTGCWPPEGSVSEATVAVYGQHGVRWLATDEGILAASLGRALSSEWGVGGELFRPWRLPAGGPVLFFRHRGFSDFIGFQASRFQDEAEAARELASNLRRTASHLPGDAGIVIALDGENPWTSYPQGGASFLVTLARELEQSTQLRLATLGERAAEEEPRLLSRLHPGSWIGGTFATWIGHPEKNRAWEMLARIRALGASRGGPSWLAAQGSDWWWWFGDDNPTILAPLYDELFRAHLRDACVAAGIPPPAELAAPVRTAAVRLVVPLSREWPPPVLDGETTSYFEWSVAAWVEASETYQRFARAALRAEPGRLWVRVEPRPGAGPPTPLVVSMVTPKARTSWTLPVDLPDRCAVGHCIEAVLPLPDGEVLLGLESGGERMPYEGLWRLELLEVDEP
jgi:alpha-amylase/alpha-mannosidase (GH57 family)